jgi:hypothetical protein
MLYEHSNTLFNYDLYKLTLIVSTDGCREYGTFSTCERTALTGYQVAFAKPW